MIDDIVNRRSNAIPRERKIYNSFQIKGQKKNNLAYDIIC